MKVAVPPGKYVVAVSGGVDSMVLLDVLAGQAGVNLVVAHFDHGIRVDSREDRLLVATVSQKYKIPFEFSEGKLGVNTSEDEARRMRYTFLRQIRKKHDAKAIITAHHQDDALETMAFNVLRGSKRKGMSSLESTDQVVRPLLGFTKVQIVDYAKRNNLQWREDSTNSDEKYTRNWIRRKLLPRLNLKQKQQLTDQQAAARARNAVLDEVVSQQLSELQSEKGISRKKFIALPYLVACEVMAAWLRQHGVKEMDSKLIDLLVVSAKTLPPGKKISVSKQTFFLIETNELVLQ